MGELCYQGGWAEKKGVPGKGAHSSQAADFSRLYPFFSKITEFRLPPK